MTDLRLLITDEPAARAADWMATRLREAITERGRASLALCGGSTPAPAYEALGAEQLEWHKVTLFFGDERCVPPMHPDSTFRMVQETLVAHTPSPGPFVVRMEGDDPEFDEAAQHYETQLPQTLDAILLGMGPDGHTASLFPGHPALQERKRRVVHVVGPKPPPDRLTLTPIGLAAARESCMLVTGASKAEKVAEVLTAPVDLDLRPAQLALGALWILDEAAAGALPAPLREEATR